MSLLPWLPLTPLLLLQGWYVRQSTPRFPPPLGETSGVIPGDGPPLRLLMLGESPVAGVGVQTMQDALIGQTANMLAMRTRRSVKWAAHGHSGATVDAYIDEILPTIPTEPVDLIAVLFGVNDTTKLHNPTQFVDSLKTLLAAVHQRVGRVPTLISAVPPLDRFPALPWPLRQFLGGHSHRLDDALQAFIHTDPGLIYVPNSLTINPDYFAPDFYHPNAAGYTIWGQALVDAALPHLDLTIKQYA